MAATLAALATLAAWVAIGSATRMSWRINSSAAVHLAIGRAHVVPLGDLRRGGGAVSFATGAIRGLEAAFLLVRRAAVARAGAAAPACAPGDVCRATGDHQPPLPRPSTGSMPALRGADVVRYHLEHIHRS